ncbi:MAG: hypothetical protein LBH00_03790 [Planctomycetaceae bacterium]|jgi:hypothetical protein|nr:hypothetical protein [Planctomycetaceae bacterium]
MMYRCPKCTYKSNDETLYKAHSCKVDGSLTKTSQSPKAAPIDCERIIVNGMQKRGNRPLYPFEIRRFHNFFRTAEGKRPFYDALNRLLCQQKIRKLPPRTESAKGRNRCCYVLADSESPLERN